MDVSIRLLCSDDRPEWNQLWRGYQAFYGVDIAPAVSDLTWRRMLDTAEPVHGLGAFQADRLVGITHFLFHRSTWLAGETCYLQDLFVVPERRGQGLARKLIEAVYACAEERGAEQVYWLTHKDNTEARRLYDRLAKNCGFVLYERFAEVDTPTD